MNTENLLDPSIESFVRPEWEYKGIRLNSFSPGRKVLFSQVVVSDDKSRNSGAWISVALIFLLTLETKEARTLAFNRDEFRQRAMAWIDKIEGDIEEITALANEILTAMEQTKVEVSSEGGTDPKNA